MDGQRGGNGFKDASQQGHPAKLRAELQRTAVDLQPVLGQEGADRNHIDCVEGVGGGNIAGNRFAGREQQPGTEPVLHHDIGERAER